MKRMLTSLFLASLALGLAGCSTLNVDTDYDPSADFSGFGTYAWMDIPADHESTRRIADPALDAQITNAIEHALDSKGIRKRTEGSPDFLIGYHAAIKSMMEVSRVNSFYGMDYGSAWIRTTDMPAAEGTQKEGWVDPRTHVWKYEQGSLIIDIADPGTKKVIWRGSVQAEVDRSDNRQTQNKRIRDAVGKMLARFPPR